jgi:hypothetical protein
MDQMQFQEFISVMRSISDDMHDIKMSLSDIKMYLNDIRIRPGQVIPIPDASVSVEFRKLNEILKQLGDEADLIEVYKNIQEAKGKQIQEERAQAQREEKDMEELLSNPMNPF